MLNLRNALYALLAISVLTGCEKPANERAVTNNAAFAVDTLFTKDGCTIYRFEDAGRQIYYVRCKESKASTLVPESCGKNCTRSVEVPTRPEE